MASISENGKTGLRDIRFIDANGKRRRIHLGHMRMKDCRELKTKVEALNAANIAKTSIDKETAEWVGRLDSVLYDKLANVGLVPKRKAPEAVEAVKLGPFLDGYAADRTDVKCGTKNAYFYVRGNLLDFFGADKPLASVTKGDADEFRRYLARPKTKKYRTNRHTQKPTTLSANTVNRRCAIAKQFFQAAVDRELIDRNPFAKMKGLAVRGNDDLKFFITRDMADRVLEACPDAESRLIFALARYGGLRCPSEHLLLRWGDVDWAGERLTVHAPKTERYAGKKSRVIPLWHDLRRYLEEAFDQAPEGSEFIITRYRKG